MNRQTNINIRRVKYAVGLSFIVVATMIVAFATANASAQVYPSGMVSYWKFDEGSGIVAYDSVGVNHGTLINNPVWTTGKVGGALNFGAGSFGVVALPVAAAMGQKANFTISAWVNADSVSGDNFIYSQDAGQYGSCGGTVGFLRISDGQAQFWIHRGGTWQSASGATTLSTGVWYQLVGTLDSSAGMTIYINGAVDGSNANNLPTDWFVLTAEIGAFYYTYYGRYDDSFNGTIDEVRIWDEALTPCQISVMAGACTPASIVSLTDALENPDPLLVPVNTTVSLEAAIVGDCGVIDALWDYGDGSPSYAESGVSDPVTTTHTFTMAGIYEVMLSLSDCSDTGPIGTEEESISVIVYDPSGGFVTGGGWIDSPAGAYKPEDTLAGKATFGFVSKYKKGANVPDGQTEFVFTAGNLNFHSSSYDWLVVAGAKAMFKGTGTVNGAGNYGFMLSAVDAAQTPSTDVDLFRIKIWDKDSGDDVVYDNQLGDAEDADPTTAIGGGSIIVHTGKK